MKEGSYPKSYRENMVWRRKIIARCKVDLLFREKVRELFFRDPLFAFNAFFFTYDPRKRPFHQQPFCTYPYQDGFILELVDCINKGRDIPVEKSRDMGASWMVVLIFLWFWLNPSGGADFLCGSRIEDYVDKKGDMRTLIEKVRYAFYKLPKWLWPEGFQKSKHDNFMRFQNPETGASITGESNNPNFSTGGRYAAILFDEFAKWESSDESAWTAAGDATPCRIPVSTPFGAGGQYYTIIGDDSVKKITLHWTLHPEKALGLYCVWPAPNVEDKEKEGDSWEPEVVLRSPWYDKESERRSAREMAQEIDINYLGSGNPVFEGKSGNSIIWYRKMKRSPVAWFKEDGEELSSPPRDSEGYLVVWKRPSSKNSYIIAADVVEGKLDGDYAVVKVFNRETKDIDASYYSLIDEVGLAFVIEKVADLYTDHENHDYPWVAIESNGPGLATFDKCLDLGVPNLFMMPRYEVAKQSVSYRKGWVTGPGSRNALIAGIKEYLIDRTGFLNPRLVGELATFVRNKVGKPEAKSGCHDDEVMCFGICLQVDQMTPWESKGIEVRKIGKSFTEVGKEEVFSIEDHRIPEEDTSIDGNCLLQALQKQEELRTIREEEFETMLDF